MLHKSQDFLIQITSETKSSQPDGYEKLFSESFAISTKDLFLKESKKQGEETILAENDIENLLTMIRAVPLYAEDNTSVTVESLKLEISTLQSNFKLQNKKHPYLPALQYLKDKVSLIGERQYLPQNREEEKAYPLLRKLDLYQEETKNIPNFFIEFCLEKFKKASEKLERSSFLQVDQLKNLVKHMQSYTETDMISLENKLRDIRREIIRVQDDHSYIKVIDEILRDVSNFKSRNGNLPLEPIEEQITNSLVDRTKRGLFWGCGLFATVSTIDLTVSSLGVWTASVGKRNKATCNYEEEHAKEFNCEYDSNIASSNPSLCRTFMNETNSVTGKPIPYKGPIFNCTSVLGNSLIETASEYGDDVQKQWKKDAYQLASLIAVAPAVAAGVGGFLYGFFKKPAPRTKAQTAESNVVSYTNQARLSLNN